MQSEWDQGYVLQVVVRNTGNSQLNGWTATATLPAGHQVVNGWNANLTTSGQTVTASSLDWNGNLAPGQEATFGFQASRLRRRPADQLHLLGPADLAPSSQRASLAHTLSGGQGSPLVGQVVGRRRPGLPITRSERHGGA